MSTSLEPTLVQAARIVAAIPLLFWLPGYFALKVPRSGCPEPIDLAEAWFLRVAASVALTSWMAVLLAELGYFSVDLLLAGQAIACFLVAMVRRRGTSGTDASLEARQQGRVAVPARGWLPVAALVVLLLAAAVVITPPFEAVLWGSDATMYLNFGKKISETGGIVFPDEFLGRMTTEAKEALFGNYAEDMTGDYARFPGGFSMPDVASSEVAGGFSPLLAVWIAIFEQLFGFPRVFYVPTLFALGSVAGVFFVGRSIQSVTAGWWAGLMLTVSLPQIWFARFSLAEVLAQFFVFAGLVAALHYLRGGRLPYGITAGLSFGVSVFVKIDLVPVLVVALVVFAAFRVFSGTHRNGDWAFVAAFALLLGHSIGHLARFPSNHRTFLSMRLVGTLDSDFSGQIVQRIRLLIASPSGEIRPEFVAAVVALSAVLVVTAIGIWRSRKSITLHHAIAYGLVTVAGFYAAAYLAMTAGVIGQTITWIGWYISWPVVTLLIVGLAVFVGQRFASGPDAELAAVLVVFFVAAFHYLYNPQEQEFGTHIWTIRRFVPIVIPMALLFVAASTVSLLGKLRPNVASWSTPLVFAVLSLLVARPSLDLTGQPAWQGGLQESRELAEMFPSDAVVLVEQDLGGIHLQTSLSYLHGLDGILLPRPLDSRAVEEAIVQWIDDERPVFLLSGPRNTHFSAPRLQLAPYRDAELEVSVLERTQGRIPQRIVTQRARLAALRFGLQAGGAKSSLDVGSYASDALFLLEGFHRPEASDDEGEPSFRWTTGEALILLSPSPRLSFILGGARPPGVAPAAVSIDVDGVTVLPVTEIPNAPLRLSVDVGANTLADLMRVTIQATTFNPAALGMSDDARDLGVRLYRIDFGGR